MSGDRIFCVRHFESVSNRGVATNDPFAIELSEHGRLAAVEFARSWEVIPDLIISSPMPRALESSRPYAHRFNARVEIWREAMEFHYLIFSGPTTPQMRSQRLSEFWGQGDIYAKDFGMESFDEFYSRVRVFLQRLRSISDDANIVVFTHGFLLQAILYQLENGFPESSSLVMKEIHERCFLRPIGNGEVIVFDKSELFGI